MHGAPTILKHFSTGQIWKLNLTWSAVWKWASENWCGNYEAVSLLVACDGLQWCLMWCMDVMLLFSGWGWYHRAGETVLVAERHVQVWSIWPGNTDSCSESTNATGALSWSVVTQLLYIVITDCVCSLLLIIAFNTLQSFAADNLALNDCNALKAIHVEPYSLFLLLMKLHLYTLGATHTLLCQERIMSYYV